MATEVTSSSAAHEVAASNPDCSAFDEELRVELEAAQRLPFVRIAQLVHQPGTQTHRTQATPDAAAVTDTATCDVDTREEGRCTAVLFHVEAPASSPYSGAVFSLVLFATPAARVWQWESPIYHPTLALKRPLCACLSRRPSGEFRTSLSVLETIRAALDTPACSVSCPHCYVDAAVLAEASLDSVFFAKKARVRTPGTSPLSDDDLRGTCVAQLDCEMLLKTGTYSDVKLMVGKCSFKCHRTVLAARSVLFRELFATTADGGVHKVNGDYCPTAFAHFLRHLYTGALVRFSDNILYDLLRLARQYQTHALYTYCCQCLVHDVHSGNIDVALSLARGLDDSQLFNTLLVAGIRKSFPSSPTQQHCA